MQNKKQVFDFYYFKNKAQPMPYLSTVANLNKNHADIKKPAKMRALFKN